MEPLPLFHFWHIHSDKNTAGGEDSDTDITLSSYETTTTNDGDSQAVGTDDDDSFFDLEFTAPLEKKQKDLDDSDSVLVRKLFPLEDGSSKPRSPISFIKSPSKLRLLTLFRNSKSEKAQGSKLQKQRSENAASRFPKVVIQKYLKMIKPLYSRASKRYTQTAEFQDEITKSTPLSPPRKHVKEKQRSRPASIRMGKSRSASSAIRSEPLPSRRDDSLLLHEDGIQSAILHCKRSYNSSRNFAVLSRSSSDEASDNRCRNSTEEVKTRTSI